jgi:hypothetical protein
MIYMVKMALIGVARQINYLTAELRRAGGVCPGHLRNLL